MTMTGEGPKELTDIKFEFSKVVYGLTEQSSRWSHCVSVAGSDVKGLSYAVGHEYIKDNFDEETKNQVRTNFVGKGQTYKSESVFLNV